MPKRGLVLAGGGVAGIAWELGVLQGIADVAPAVSAALLEADVIVGTSAGAAVAAQVTSGLPLIDLYSAQLRQEHDELEVHLAWHTLMARFAAIAAGAPSVRELRRRLGALAPLPDVEPEARHQAIRSRIPLPHWPEARIVLAAVDAEAGELVAFEGGCGVGLVEAVAASCAVPGVWPQVVIDGRRYIDGGVPSSTNAHLAAGCERVLVLTPVPAGQPAPFAPLPEEVDYLDRTEVLTVSADTASAAGFSRAPLSPATRGPAARAGRRVGRGRAAEIAAFWCQDGSLTA
ncbi:patatin-like phospholipase family protein [Amycolatopsis thermoflava]|uniref:NTE family protein n=1 Tax=Amycolatopsis thermoflava TaxID=84480 RepID=A0A3N2H668_9PSEU|nr:patatin-like phospholipase family protein [Amycolatopsis thermoflava]ROS43969.1 NTE family protein [Amycolatopsis thermoflava]